MIKYDYEINLWKSFKILNEKNNLFMINKLLLIINF